MVKIENHPTDTSLFLKNGIPFPKNVWEIYTDTSEVTATLDDFNESKARVGIRHKNKELLTLQTPLTLSQYVDSGGVPYADIDSLVVALNGIIVDASAGIPPVTFDTTPITDKLEEMRVLLADDATKQEQIRVLLNDLKDQTDGLEVGQTLTNTKLDELKDLVDTLETLGADQLTELQAIKGFVDGLEAGQTLTNTKLDELKGFVDGLEAQLTTLIDEVDQVEELLQANIDKNEEIRALLAAETDVNIQENFGTDDANGTPIREIVTYEDLSPTRSYIDSAGAAYTLVGNFTPFSPSGNAVQTIFYKAKIDGTGFLRNEIIKNTRVIDSSDGSIISNVYTNLNTGTSVNVTATVEQLEGNFTLPNSTILETEPFFVMSNAAPYDIIGLVYKSYYQDGTFDWLDISRNIVQDPIVAGQKIVSVYDERTLDIKYKATNPIGGPKVFQANTLKYLFVNVIGGEYSIQIGNNPAVTYTSEDAIFSREEVSNKLAYIRDEITITEIVAGELILQLATPSTNPDLVNVDPQLTSAFIFDPSLSLQPVGSFVTEIDLPDYLNNPDTLTKTTGSDVERLQVNGLDVLRSESLFGTGSFASSPVAISESVVGVATFFEFNRAGIGSERVAFGVSNPAIQIRYNPTTDQIRTNVLGNFTTFDYTTLNLTAGELAGTDAIILTWSNVTNGVNRDITFKLYSVNNPNGLTFHTEQVPLNSGGNYSGGVIGLQYVIFMAADEITNEANLITLLKGEANLTF